MPALIRGAGQGTGRKTGYGKRFVCGSGHTRIRPVIMVLLYQPVHHAATFH